MLWCKNLKIYNFIWFDRLICPSIFQRVEWNKDIELEKRETNFEMKRDIEGFLAWSQLTKSHKEIKTRIILRIKIFLDFLRLIYFSPHSPSNNSPWISQIWLVTLYYLIFSSPFTLSFILKLLIAQLFIFHRLTSSNGLSYQPKKNCCHWCQQGHWLLYHRDPPCFHHSIWSHPHC